MDFYVLQRLIRMNLILISALFITVIAASSSNAGPYVPAAGLPGSTAISMTDPAFAGWGTGWKNYNPGTEVASEFQTPDKALGKAVGTSDDIVSLGRGGEITMTFDAPVIDGAGYDFAVFENSFSDTFLELAFVEVSSDGSNFYRFPNNSLTQSPVGGFGNVDPTDVYQLAGKYRQGYGTPFDLDMLNYAGYDLNNLDFGNIRWVKIIDIVGDGSVKDTYGYTIYDPYPTYGSAGFDLDAIGVIHQGSHVPIPGAVWLFGTGLIGLIGIRKRC